MVFKNLTSQCMYLHFGRCFIQYHFTSNFLVLIVFLLWSSGVHPESRVNSENNFVSFTCLVIFLE